MQKTGIELISEERQRQIEAEGYMHEHDAGHTDGALAFAAAAYAAYPCTLFTKSSEDHVNITFSPVRPFNENINAKDELRNLVIAGALIAAEIDRITKPNNNFTPNKDWKSLRN